MVKDIQALFAQLADKQTDRSALNPVKLSATMMDIMRDNALDRSDIPDGAELLWVMGRDLGISTWVKPANLYGFKRAPTPETSYLGQFDHVPVHADGGDTILPTDLHIALVYKDKVLHCASRRITLN